VLKLLFDAAGMMNSFHYDINCCLVLNNEIIVGDRVGTSINLYPQVYMGTSIDSRTIY
jgi:hypothetical protein